MTALVSTAGTRRGCSIVFPILKRNMNRGVKSYSTTLPTQYSFDNRSFGSEPSSIEISRWPITKPNTILNIVPEGKKYIVERLGKLHEIQHPGYFFAVPFFDRIAYVVDMRERALDIIPQAAITRDNVSVQVSGNLFVKINDAELAAYGANHPIYSVMQHAQSAMRSAIGEMELDEILHNRARLNGVIKSSLQEAASAWGLLVRRYEITEITPDEEIRVAMDKQAAAERDRREQVLRAEGDKRRAELESEGFKISLTNQSEGTLIKIRNEAEATKTKLTREAEGEAEAIRIKAEAQADAIARIAKQLETNSGSEAAKLALAHAYVGMYGEMGSKSNTMFFNGGGGSAGDVTSLLVQAGAALGTIPDTSQKKNKITSVVKSTETNNKS